jgi:tRNA (cytidine/uridine-2'-O-)-methyltransferase
MLKDLRSLNLSNAVAIMAYEALRQNNFESLLTTGELHNLAWEN